MNPEGCGVYGDRQTACRKIRKVPQRRHGADAVLRNQYQLKKEAAEKRREQVQKMVEQVEREAREKRAAEQDDMYADEEE